MSKYEALGDFLRQQDGERVPLSFADVERITGVKLPPSADKHQPWWSNNPSNNTMTRVWLDAGFESEHVDLPGRRLVFRRVRYHPLVGILKNVTFVPPGVDLTEPPDADWGKN